MICHISKGLEKRNNSRLFRDLTNTVKQIRGYKYWKINLLSTSFKEDCTDCVEPLIKGQWGPTISELNIKKSRPAITPEEVAEKFNIGLERAKQTLKVTTQKGI